MGSYRHSELVSESYDKWKDTEMNGSRKLGSGKLGSYRHSELVSESHDKWKDTKMNGSRKLGSGKFGSGMLSLF